ncbi:MAG TPA: type II toxin-antitoxin system RelE/ParE family toxin [Aliidongia sp.]|uniref:type II toxin-antitoxin system RelE/ParE family toxin n=1 Tax=Aliidongia sp. TaxID=1914230 RepID=UPI002DDD27B0|nr:type II toxin-antitoxin system RelE/ParE family toxin [Aliidongia sp.]HEV2677842.1 type II toxin-antitoxin system RelE/ParE family toxin [Aliidongia sp.]
MKIDDDLKGSCSNQRAARRADQTIERQLAILETTPEIGRPYTDFPEFRGLIIEFGNSGYDALYRCDLAVDAVYILAFAITEMPVTDQLRLGKTAAQGAAVRICSTVSAIRRPR